MTPIEFAGKHFQDFIERNGEIVPKYCPFCHGGNNKDKYTFALNAVKMTYNCKRGTCGVQGHFSQLLKEFGEVAVKNDRKAYIKPKKVYTKPQNKPETITETAINYLKQRGISENTASVYRIGVDANGNLLFPYFNEKDEHVFNKFRYPRKLKSGDRKAWRESGTMPILFGMWKCDDSKPLCITEGEFDALACHESGIPNAVSVPSGAEDFTWIDTCWEWLEEFNSVVLFGDNDEPGKEMIKKLAARLPHKRVYVVEHEYKDANELLFRNGKDDVLRAYMGSKEIPAQGLINLAEVTPLDMENLRTIPTSIPELDRVLGGFLFGDVSVWTGRRGEGKSTLLSQMCLDSIEAGEKVCVYSGELKAARFQYWVDLQAAGPDILKEFTRNERTYYTIPHHLQNEIHNWYNGWFWLYDNSLAGTEEEVSILRAFEIGAKRYGCTVFMVDNLMTAKYESLYGEDYYRAQSNFVGELVSFANKYNAHVHLVAHPKKTDGKRHLDNDDVSGTGDITNRVANVFSLERLSEDKAQEHGYGIALSILKNRWEGNVGKVGLNYCPKSRRLYVPNRGNIKKYSWSEEPRQTFIEDNSDEPLPW